MTSMHDNVYDASHRQYGNAMTFWETKKYSLYVVYVLHDDSFR